MTIRKSSSVNKTLPNFVVIALDSPGKATRLDDLLREHPEVRVIAVAPRELHRLLLGSLDIHSSNIEASEEGMLNALRNKLVTSETN
jgi:hypothetical protein